MRRMWREGHRRSPRISALDARKAQPSRPKSSGVQSRFSTNTIITSTSTNLHVAVHQQNKRRRLRHGEGPASRTRAKKKRKLRPLQDVASPLSAQQDLNNDEQDEMQSSDGDVALNDDKVIVQSKDSRKHGDQVTNPDQPHTVPFASRMPEKRILELILDVLQRRDNHEIFAEPVDPNEVEDYYEIIKEPMDFGTMRAKLHEGMYRSLEQFEHDVFLISKNAMHFNSSSTIYFRQARAIDELAKKVFCVLKTDPENFELEFSGSRRRNTRRPKGEARSSTYSSSSKPATNSRSNSATPTVPRKPILSSASSILNLRTKTQVMPCYTARGITTLSDIREDEVPFGGGDGRGSNSSEANRRSTYRPCLSILDDNYSIVSKIYNNSKLLMHVNQQDINYRKSLKLFVKDLGLTAQMVAQRKLDGWSIEATNYMTSASNYSKTPNCKNVTSSFDQWISSTADAPIKWSQSISNGNRIDMCDTNKGDIPHSGDKISICGTSMEAASHGNQRSIFGATRLEAQSRNNMDTVSSRIHIGPHSSIISARDPNFLVANLNNKEKMHEKSRSSDSDSKYSNSNVLEHRLSDNCSFSSPSWQLDTMTAGASGFGQTIGSTNNLQSRHLRSYDQATAGLLGVTQEICSSYETDMALKSNHSLTPVSQFIFDLPFLKTQLDQMNSVGPVRFLQQSSDGQVGFLDRMSETYHHDNQLTSLALQL
ncbi:hypothetical protein JCGZ_00622 [Jatropha curcas]|uniref:Bromo domain-containing protein n=3 Tax=Jatropha curcas TaxID=180498 RepID=A0A067JPA3_JATCU|nr:uncharacterized protein LOC105649067 isoform X2 [Jatropha curcas]KDP21835.1 hypothetical protein JCGZ_00622 [Jatropha curcas]